MWAQKPINIRDVMLWKYRYAAVVSSQHSW